MDQDTKIKKKCSGLKNIFCFFTSKEEQDAQLLDDMQNLSKISLNSDLPPAPPGEFNSIMAEMERRGIKTKISRQANGRDRIRRVRRALQKPAVAGLLVVIILCATSAGVAAKKSYNYRLREREAGKSNIVWNNDQHILTEVDELEKAYVKIEELIGIKSLKMKSSPFDMKFESLMIEEGSAVVKFKYNNIYFYFIQAKYPISASNGVVSDREGFQPIYNVHLNETLYMDKNEIGKGVVEYSSYIELKGAYYYLAGVVPKEEFVDIIESLDF